MILRMSPEAMVDIAIFVVIALLVAAFAFLWREWATMLTLWFTDRAAYRARVAEHRAAWDDRDGW